MRFQCSALELVSAHNKSDQGNRPKRRIDGKVDGIFPQLVQRDFGAVSKCILIIEDSGCLRRYDSDFVQACNGRQFIEPTTFALTPRFNPSPRV
jgi:hypothetical protein